MDHYMIDDLYKSIQNTQNWNFSETKSKSEVNEFEPRLKPAKNRFQLSARLNLETLNTILSGTNHIWAASLL